MENFNLEAEVIHRFSLLAIDNGNLRADVSIPTYI